MDNNFRPVRFFCIKCGKEIWENMTYDLFYNEPFGHLTSPKCSDCILEDARLDDVRDRIDDEDDE